MKKILETSFEGGRLPDGWFEELRRCSFEGEKLISGGGAVVHVPLGTCVFETVTIEVEIEAPGGEVHLSCSDGVATILLNRKVGRHLINYAGLALLSECTEEISVKPERVLVTFIFDQGDIWALINGAEVLFARDPRFTPSRMFTLGFWEDCRVSGIRVFGDGGRAYCPPTTNDTEQELEMNVDFFDDLLYAPWTHGMLDNLFAKFSDWGVRRCHWIHYGRGAEGWWDYAPFDVAKNARLTMENVGEIFPAAVAAAHRHGIEIYGLIKPFDMGLSQGPVLAEIAGRLPRVGGALDWVAEFPARRRDLIMARKPGLSGPAATKVFTRIDLVKEDAAPAAFGIDDVQLFVSDDNKSYRPYAGPVEREEAVEDYPIWEHNGSGGRPTGQSRPARVMRWEGLSISEPFVALKIKGGARSFANTLINLIHVFGAEGEERCLTYGLAAREVGFELTENVASVAMEPDFEKSGVQYDTAPGTPTSIFPGYEAICARWVFDTGEGMLAFAAGKNDGPIAALSPSFPETRAWWLSWVQDCLDAGADGIELRIRNHHSHLTWSEYGFEKPVRDEFLRRHGIDIWASDDFDHAAWEQLRGEGYTQFCRDAREMTRSYGKRLGLHISLTNLKGPAGKSAMNIEWNWELWLKEGLADSITLKDILPGSRLADEILSRAKRGKVKVIFCPYANDLWLQPGGASVCDEWIALAKREGCDGFQFYECAAILRGTKEGELLVTQPGLVSLLEERFKQEGRCAELI